MDTSVPSVTEEPVACLISEYAQEMDNHTKVLMKDENSLDIPI